MRWKTPARDFKKVIESSVHHVRLCRSEGYNHLFDRERSGKGWKHKVHTHSLYDWDVAHPHQHLLHHSPEHVEQLGERLVPAAVHARVHLVAAAHGEPAALEQLVQPHLDAVAGAELAVEVRLVVALVRAGHKDAPVQSVAGLEVLVDEILHVKLIEEHVADERAIAVDLVRPPGEDQTLDQLHL